MNFFYFRRCSLRIEVSPDSGFNQGKYFGSANFLLAFNLFWFLHFIAQLIGRPTSTAANKVASLQMINREAQILRHFSAVGYES